MHTLRDTHHTVAVVRHEESQNHTMKKRTIKITVIAFFSLVFTQMLHAQEKCDLAIVKYFNHEYTGRFAGIHISISNQPYQKIEVPKSDVEFESGDYTFLLNYLSDMQEEGWVVINTFSESGPLFFILEKRVTINETGTD